MENSYTNIYRVIFFLQVSTSIVENMQIDIQIMFNLELIKQGHDKGVARIATNILG